MGYVLRPVTLADVESVVTQLEADAHAGHLLVLPEGSYERLVRQIVLLQRRTPELAAQGYSLEVHGRLVGFAAFAEMPLILDGNQACELWLFTILESQRRHGSARVFLKLLLKHRRPSDLYVRCSLNSGVMQSLLIAEGFIASGEANGTTILLYHATPTDH